MQSCIRPLRKLGFRSDRLAAITAPLNNAAPNCIFIRRPRPQNKATGKEEGNFNSCAGPLKNGNAPRYFKQSYLHEVLVQTFRTIKPTIPFPAEALSTQRLRKRPKRGTALPVQTPSRTSKEFSGSGKSNELRNAVRSRHPPPPSPRPQRSPYPRASPKYARAAQTARTAACERKKGPAAGSGRALLVIRRRPSAVKRSSACRSGRD